MWNSPEFTGASTLLSLGLLGRGIQHSQGQKIYENLLNRRIDYHLFDYENPSFIPPLKYFFERVQGLSITSPYKRHFLPVIENLSNFPAVNCIKKSGEHYLGTNTDYLAIVDILKNYKQKYGDLHASVLGDGTTSQVLQQSLRETQISFLVYSRKQNGDLNLVSRVKQSSQELVINACSRDFVFKPHLIKELEDIVFWDLNYNFPPHDYLKTLVSDFQDGMELLQRQAKYALEFWKIT